MNVESDTLNYIQNTIIMQRSFFNMSDEVMAAFHGWSLDRLQLEIANCAKRMSELGIAESSIMNKLRIDETTLRNILYPQRSNDVIALASQVSILVTKVNDMENHIKTLQDEIKYLKSKKDENHITSSSRDRLKDRSRDSSRYSSRDRNDKFYDNSRIWYKSTDK